MPARQFYQIFLSLFFTLPLLAQPSQWDIPETYPAETPHNLDLYLVIGQSNMAGRAEIPEEDRAPLQGVYLYTGEVDRPWAMASNPLNRYSTIRKKIEMQRLSPAYAFARTMAAESEREIGLVMNARGGTGIVQWLPGTNYYREAVERAKKALRYGKLRGVIWHQGESDSGDLRREMYLGRLEVLINALREEFDLPNLPFVAGEIAEDRPGREVFNQMLRQLPGFIPSTGLASSRGTGTFDHTHFDTRSQLLMGERYAVAMLKIQARHKARTTALEVAQANATAANEGFRRCYDFLHAWMGERDKRTGLIPRNLMGSKDIWNAQDAAADNYPFMVLTAALLDEPVFKKDMRDMLAAETKLTSRLGALPDTYSFTKRDFDSEEPNLDAIIFGASEYIKDGLLPLTEWLGHSPWSERMLAILDDIWRYAPVETPFGKIPSTNVEVNGEMLQTLARVYWMTGEEKYLDWAVRLGDYYLLGDRHPTRDMETLRLRDHGCEIVSGLCELYFTVSYARKVQANAYRPAIHEMLDRILETGLNDHGLMYDAVNPQTGEITRNRVADNWGYNYNGFYTVQMVDGTEKYREAIDRALSNLVFYKNFDWETGSQDGYADAIEGGLNLYNRMPNPIAEDWLDSEIQVMWSMQDSSHRSGTEQWRDNGIIEGWHGDGNFARTSIMYCFWKTQGTYLKPWRPDVVWGAERRGKQVTVYLKADRDWKGQLFFDHPRHQEVLKLPADYPRINQFPEWFTVEEEATYTLRMGADDPGRTYTGTELRAGVPVELEAGEEVIVVVEW